MTVVLTDTLTGNALPLEPLEEGHVRIYSCGPTVYGPAHIGNFRSFLFADVLVRYLRWRGLRVTWVMNITDVDDKIIKGAAAAGVPVAELTARWTDRFLDDASAMRMTTPDALPRATQHIPEIVDLIERLEAAGHAYRTPDGSIFFSIASWPAYGRLARVDASQQRVGDRVIADEYAKDDIRDFVLWKAVKPGEPSWETSIGPGRPGWHIECSAMSMRQLGESFDVHTGGIDLIFPHHEDEIAQSEAATGVPFVRTWLHCAHLVLGGAKMAKSVGNIARVSDLLAAGVSARALRYALICVPYRTPLEYSDASLAAAAAALERLDALDATLAVYSDGGPDDGELPAVLDRARETFDAAMADDLNVSAALAVLFDLVREINRRVGRRQLSRRDAEVVRTFMRDLDRILAILPDDHTEELEADLAALLEARAAARRDRDWAASDRLRDELAGRGIAVDDTPDGQRWRREPSTTGWLIAPSPRGARLLSPGLPAGSPGARGLPRGSPQAPSRPAPSRPAPSRPAPSRQSASQPALATTTASGAIEGVVLVLGVSCRSAVYGSSSRTGRRTTGSSIAGRETGRWTVARRRSTPHRSIDGRPS